MDTGRETDLYIHESDTDWGMDLFIHKSGTDSEMDVSIHESQHYRNGGRWLAMKALVAVCGQEAAKLEEREIEGRPIEDSTKLYILASICARAIRAEALSAQAGQGDNDDLTMTDLPEDTGTRVAYLDGEIKTDIIDYDTDETVDIQRPSEEVRQAQQQVAYADGVVTYTNAETEIFQDMVDDTQKNFDNAKEKLRFDTESRDIAREGHRAARLAFNEAQIRADFIITGIPDKEEDDHDNDNEDGDGTPAATTEKTPCRQCGRHVFNLDRHTSYIHSRARQLRLEAMKRATDAVRSGAAADYPCPWCERVYGSVRTLGRHMAVRHEAGPPGGEASEASQLEDSGSRDLGSGSRSAPGSSSDLSSPSPSAPSSDQASSWSSSLISDSDSDSG